MPKKKAAEPQAAPAKKAPAKRASKSKDESTKVSRRLPAGVKISNTPITVGSEKPKKIKSEKLEAKPVKSEPKRKNTKHEDVPNEVVLSALGSGKPSSKSELVAACGGDAVAVTKTIQRLRGLGQIVVKGSTRNAVYSKAA